VTVLPAVALRLSEQTRRPAALAERARVAREIHDVLAHSLAHRSFSLNWPTRCSPRSPMWTRRWPLSSGRVGWLSARRADRDVTRVRNGLLRVSNDVVDVVQDATDGAVFGLTGMRDRLALAGGTLISAPQGGEWEVVAEGPE
jgi:signal transduction histidine kinase